MSQTQTEVLFYHLERQPLDAVLPTLIEKSLERGWRVIVQAGSTERLEAIDSLLWTYSEGSFIPHAREGAAGKIAAERQPVWLTVLKDNKNGAHVRFVVDGATLDSFDGLDYARIVIMFDGGDPAALTQARADWKRVSTAGLKGTYWQQNAQGRWERKA